MSSNAPHWINNTPVPMDTSNRARAPMWRARPAQGNIAQVEPNQTTNLPPRRCYNCNKIGHLAAVCQAPKKARINSVIDKPEDVTNQQTPLTPDGILDNALGAFDRLPDQLKDEFIWKYEGESQDFPGV